MGRHSVDQADLTWVGLLEHMNAGIPDHRELPVPVLLSASHRSTPRHSKPSMIADAYLRAAVWVWIILGDLASALQELFSPSVVVRLNTPTKRPRHRVLVNARPSACGRVTDDSGRPQQRLQHDATRDDVTTPMSFPWMGAAGAVSRHVTVMILLLSLALPMPHSAPREEPHVLVQLW